MHRASNEARRRGTLEIAPLHLLLALVAGPEFADVVEFVEADRERLREDVRAALDA